MSKEKKFVFKTEFILMNIHEEVVLKEVTLSGLKSSNPFHKPPSFRLLAPITILTT
jgi:hypothetical protein